LGHLKDPTISTEETPTFSGPEKTVGPPKAEHASEKLLKRGKEDIISIQVLVTWRSELGFEAGYSERIRRRLVGSLVSDF
jgi:hypothetical protein